MLLQISEKSKQAFEAAAQKLGRTAALPDVSAIPEDLGLYLKAHYMLATIIEAEKDGEVYDFNDHEHYKYEPWNIVDEGYEPGSSGGGFRLFVCVSGRDYTAVGARLCSNSRETCKANANKYPDLWEIVKLIVK